MTHQNNKLVVVHMDARKLKREPDASFPSFSKAKLEKLIDLPPWPNRAEDRCPRSAVADASARRRGMDRGLPLLA